MSRKIIFNLAMSIDGYILDKDGKYDFIKGDGNNTLDTEKKFDFPSFLESIDTVIVGKTAFENDDMSFFQNKNIIVATSSKKENYSNVTFTDNVIDYVKTIQSKDGKNIWLYGGAKVVDAFLKENIIDEFIIGVVPTILGSGLKLFYDNNPTINLQLEECTIQEGLTILKYSKKGI